MKSKALTILLSFAIAFALWLYVITVERTTIEYTFYNVPVVLDGESVLSDRGLMLNSDTDRTVNLTLSGKRSDLNKMKSSDITVLVDLTRIYEAGEKSLSYDVSFPGDVQNSAIEIVSRQPDSIQVSVAQWASQEIPVEIEITGTPADSYRVDFDNISADPETVGISGPKELIDQIAMGKITVNMDGAKESFEQRQRVTLCDALGNPIEADLSKVFVDNHMILTKVPVLMEREITLSIGITPGGGLETSDVSLWYSFGTDKITVVGSPSVVSKMKDVIELDRFDLGQPVEGFENKEYTIPVPEGVTIQQGDVVEVTMTVPPRATRTISIPQSQFDVLGLPEGYEVTFARKAIEVTVLGKSSILSKLETTDFRVVVDLGDNTASGSYPVQIEILNMQNVSIVEDPDSPYKVYALLIQGAPEA
ncbi:MAG: hypothetical protein IJW14_01485 [Oscillospiraceae bacterium]|nr:hypothetical protein [Oscillospiraceae bacterium]